ncbi:MAG: enoyl-CoA hydratase-related protein [Deltaproteobacteria bacterium]|nr:enoyl-CoA hydratase-related protein [Deltaproteobacteria bacterium]
MSYENLKVEVEGGIATVTIDRPKALNALNPETITELGEAFAALRDSGEVRVAILTGGGEKAFVAGADISAMAGYTVEEARHFATLGQKVFDSLAEMPFPVIAAVNGFALGGGCELALACDLVYASTNAKLGQPEVNLGVIPGFGGTQRLARRVGIARAKELILTGNVIKADAARSMGLVLEVFEPGALLPKVKEIAKTIAAKGPLAVAQAKRAIDQGQDVGLPSANALEVHAFAQLFGSEDQKEGMAAFLEKRDAKFQGR